MTKPTKTEVINNGRVAATAELVHDTSNGPVVWVQGDCYIPVDQLDQFIDGLRNTAGQTATSA